MTNRELVEHAIDAGNRFDAETLESLFSDDVVVDFSRSVGPARGVYRGEDEVRAFFESYMEAFESAVATTLEVYERGDFIAVDMRVRFRGRGSGVDIKARGARVYELHDGKITRYVQFQNFEDACEFVDGQA